jgi:hypothetical protein
VDLVEPPSCNCNIVFIGRNSRGQWVAQQRNGLFGGLFVNRTDAVRYALFENGRHPESIIAISGVLELDMNATSSMDAPTLATRDPDQRRVA